MRTRFLIPAVALLAMLAAAIPAFAQEEADDDAPPPSHSAELRVWQSIADPLDGLWVSARADEDARWTTTALNIAMREGGGWRIANLTVDALDGELDVRVWQDPSDLRELWLSARPAGGSWEEHGTKRLDLDARSRSGRYRYDDLAVALEWPDAEPPAPGESRDALCIPEGLERERLFTRVWRSVATPHRYWISARPDADARWSTRAVSLAESGVDGWNAGGLTFDAGEADFELRLWVGDGGLYLSTRVAGTTWHEDGTRRLNLTRTSTSGRYTYANRTVRLTLPEAEPPDPGTSVRDWDCPETGTGGGTRTGDGDGGTGEGGGPGAPGSGGNTAPTANAGADRHVAPGAASIQLDGSGSSDPDGDTLTYSWAQTGGATVKNLTGTDTASPSFEFPDGASVGDTFTFTLTVDDGNDESDTDDVTITVNTPPQVDEITIDIDISVNASAQAADTVTAMANTPSVNCDAANVHCANRGATVTLTATVTDPDGTMTYQWAHTGGTYAGSTISLSGNATLTASFTMPMDANQGDTVVVTFTATDSLGATGTATATITARNRAPHADADDDQTASVGDTVTLDGSDSADPDGDTLTYSWAKTGGTYTGAVSLTGSTTASPSFDVDAALAGLTAIFTLTVDDGHGGSDTDTVTVTVNQQQGGGGSPPPGGGQQPGQRVNEPPTADAGDDRTFAADATVTLDGSDSKDDSAISTWEWALTGGTYTGSLQIADGETTSFYMPDAAGKTLIITLTVTDDEGETATDTVTITGAATALTLDAGSDASVQRGATHNLSGTYTDADSSSTPTYQWTSSLGSVTNSTTLSSTIDADKPKFTVPLAATANQAIVLTLTVTDGGVNYVDTVTITALNTDPTGATATATPASQKRGSVVTLSGSADADANGDTLTYSWAKTGGTYTGAIGALSGATANFQVPTGAAIGATIVFTLTVADGAGGSDTDTVTITATNAALTNPNAGADRTVNRGATVSLSGSATDPEGSTLVYAWTPANLLTDANTSTPDFTVPLTATIGQTYTFTMTVKDENGGTGHKTATDYVTITAANVAPTAAPSASSATATEGDSITLNANASDTENSTLTYAWTQTAGTTVTLSSTTAASPTFTAPGPTSVPETLTFSVTVKDENGGTGHKTATGTVSVTVNNLKPEAVASATKKTVNQGETVTLDGSGSTDDGALTYSWAHLWRNAGGTYDCPPPTPNCTLTATASGATASFTAPGINAWHARNIGQSMTLIWELTVTDSTGLTDKDRVTITVQNEPPSAPTISGTPTNVTTGASYTLTASGSEDPDGTDTNVTYNWSVSGPSGAPAASVSSSGSKSGVVTIPANAAKGNAYKVTAKAVDEDGGVSGVSNVLTLTVNNRPPVAIAKGNHYKVQNTQVSLIALESSDPDGDTITCSWAKTGGTYDGQHPVTLTANPSNCTGIATFTIPIATIDANSNITTGADWGDTFVLTLTVTDAKGGTDTADFTVTVGNTVVGNSAPTANPGAATRNVSMANGNKVTLDGSASSDPEGGALTYWWGWIGGSTGKPGVYTSSHSASAYFYLVDPANTSKTFFPVNTSYWMKLTVHDHLGLSDSSNVYITRTNVTPTVNAVCRASTSAPCDSNGQLQIVQKSTSTTNANPVTVTPSVLTLGATVSDADTDQTLTHTWTKVYEKGVNDFIPPDTQIVLTQVSCPQSARMQTCANVTVKSAAPAGTYQIWLDSSDGIATVSDYLTVTVNTLPTITRTSSNITVTQGTASTHTVSVSVTEADGHTLTHKWILPASAGTDLTLDSTSAASTTLRIKNTARNGVYDIKVKVWDSLSTESDAAESTVTVTIN